MTIAKSQPRPQTKSWRTCFAAVCAAFGLAAAAGPVAAGQPCETRDMNVTEIRNGINLAAQTAQAMETHAVQAGVIARMGQDLSKWRQRYSHVGLVYRSNAPGGTVVWRVVHKLNDCGTDTANIYRQGLAEFFTDAPHDWETAVVPLSPAAARQVLAMAGQKNQLTRLHEPRYSMVAYPWATQYQQSNQWVLETLAMMIEPQIRRRTQAQSWLNYKGYEPDRLRLGTFTRLGARVTKANIEFNDHPSRLRFSGRIDTTTADSALRWLEQSGIGQQRIVIRLDQHRQYGPATNKPTNVGLQAPRPTGSGTTWPSRGAGPVKNPETSHANQGARRGRQTRILNQATTKTRQNTSGQTQRRAGSGQAAQQFWQ